MDDPLFKVAGSTIACALPGTIAICQNKAARVDPRYLIRPVNWKIEEALVRSLRVQFICQTFRQLVRLRWIGFDRCVRGFVRNNYPTLRCVATGPRGFARLDLTARHTDNLRLRCFSGNAPALIRWGDPRLTSLWEITRRDNSEAGFCRDHLLGAHHNWIHTMDKTWLVSVVAGRWWVANYHRMWTHTRATRRTMLGGRRSGGRFAIYGQGFLKWPTWCNSRSVFFIIS